MGLAAALGQGRGVEEKEGGEERGGEGRDAWPWEACSSLL